MVLILASASTIRRQLLENAGLSFSAQAANIDERALQQDVQNASLSGATLALRLAEAKANAVSLSSPGALVIGADQTLIHKGETLHKPRDLAAARTQLQSLRGGKHYLYSAAALVCDGQLLWSHAEAATLTLRAFTTAELNAVLDEEGEALLSSVGSYRLEGPSIRLFDKVEGDYFAILGLPLLALLHALRQHGFPA